MAVPKGKYSKLPEQEKVFLFQISHFLNEIWVLQKTIIVSQNGIDRLKEPEFGARISQSHFFIKLLAGTLWEAWVVTSKGYLSMNKPPYHLEKQADEALSKLKTYFSKKNNINYIRNKHAFHADSTRITEGIKLLGTDPLEYLVPTGDGGIFCHLAETADNAALLHHIDSTSLEGALKKLFGEVVMSVPDWFSDFGNGVIWEICQKLKAKHTEEEVAGVRKISELQLPYFTLRP